MKKTHNRTKHGMYKTRTYRIWTSMLNRCRNKNCNNYDRYGGKGIKVCDRWKYFENFWEDMKDGYTDQMTIDRIDNNGNYEPSNCRWVNAKEQLRHKSTIKRFEYAGELLTIPQLAEKLGMNRWTLYTRIKSGWNIERAISEPVKKYHV